MAYDRFMIAPISTGLETDIKPWLLPDDAYANLVNAYVFRGRIRKRFGSYLMGSDPADPQLSRLRMTLVPAVLTVTTFSNIVVGQQFSIDADIFTVTSISFPVALLTTSAVTATLISANQVTFSAIAGTVYWYPGLPVMGITNYETGSINDEPTYAFDTQFAYQFTAGAWERLGTAVWTGDNSQFFWTDTWHGNTAAENILFVTNFNTPDRTKYWTGSTWVDFMPVLNTTSRLLTARVIVNFKNRLLYFNTVEDQEGVNIGTTDPATGNFGPSVAPGGVYEIGQSFVIGSTTFTVISDTPGAQPMAKDGTQNVDVSSGTFDVSTGTVTITGNGYNADEDVFFLSNSGLNPSNFFSRCRFSQNGSPISGSAWRDDVPGRGGFVEASTQEQIVTVEFIKDRLIVFFERSTWELAWTGNDVYPFQFLKINTELGCESTFSVVPFDKVTLAVGNVGIHACNGSNVERIDQKIPQAVFDIHNDNGGVYRVAGIRDYYVEMVYWTFPSVDRSTDYPFTNRVLVFNYATGSWAFNEDSITAFGYYQNQANITWSTSTETWAEAISVWGSGVLQARFRQVIAGNQQGFVFVIEPNLARNAAALSITNISQAANVVTITAINHNLQANEWIAIENAQGMTDLNDIIYQVYEVLTSDTFTVLSTIAAGTYTGGGTIARVSNINILTKPYNFYVDKGRNSYIAKVDFLVDKTSDGEVTVDYFPSYSTISLLDDGSATGALLGSGVLETSPYALVPLENEQEQLWHPIYTQAEGEGIQLRIYLSDDQIVDMDIAWSDFELNAMTFYTMPTASRLQ